MEKKETYLTLTEVDKSILNSYKNLVEHLGNYLGEGYEIILHSLEDLHHSAIKIHNGHYSGRKEGAPITNVALEMLSQIECTKNCDAINYMNRSSNGTPLYSTTIPILGENNRIIGLFCMNFYTNIPLSSILSKFLTTNFQTSNITEISETFTDNADELIKQSVYEIKQKVFGDMSISQSNKNKEIIAKLNEKGIFNLKDSVIKVAELLQISKNTVYMHLRSMNRQQSK